MRLPEIEHGDSIGSRALIGLISLVSGMRLPDAARVAFYHKDFVSRAMGQWTQATMRGPSRWSISERELMAASVARWNACTFCIGAHRAIAIKGMDQATVDAALTDYTRAPISPQLRTTLALLEKMTREPDGLTSDDMRTALNTGLSVDALEDALAVGALFNVIARYADALKFAIPTDAEFNKAADMLLKRGYGS